MSAPDSAEPVPAVVSQSFEEAMERLEAVVGEMENSKLPLEDLIRCYEEGTKLVKVCTERLAAAEQRIDIITRDAAGESQVTSYPPAAAPAAPKTTVRDPKPAPKPPAVAPGRSAKKSNEVSLF